MIDLLNFIRECIQFVSENVPTNLAEIRETWSKCSQHYAGIVDKINVTWRVSLDIDLLEEFPDIKSKVAQKLDGVGNEQLSVLRVLAVQMFQINECLKMKLDIINDKIEQISFEEYKDLEYTISEHVIWLEDCWKCLHCFYMQLHFSLISLDMSNEETTLRLINAINQNEVDKLTLGKSQAYMQSCLSLVKFVENRNKVKLAM